MTDHDERIARLLEMLRDSREHLQRMARILLTPEYRASSGYNDLIERISKELDAP